MNFGNEYHDAIVIGSGIGGLVTISAGFKRCKSFSA